MDFQDRVMKEKLDLDENISKLTSFLSTDIFKNLDKEDKKLLKHQLHYMGGYSDTLKLRIERF